MKTISNAMAMAMMAAPMLGCGAPTPAGVASLPDDFTGPGTYTVPAVPAVQYALAKVRIEQANGSVSVYYDLPAELVGQTTQVELTGAPDATGAIQLSGDAGTSTCTVAPGLLRCEEHLSGIQVGKPPASPPLSDPQRAAAQAFLSDPIGVLSVPLPP